MAKGHDHEIVKVLETYPKAVLWRTKIQDICVIVDLQLSIVV